MYRHTGILAKDLVSTKCFGCARRIEIALSDPSSCDETFRMLGWVRRQFHPSANPWFCSEECSVNSGPAKFAEDYWTNYWVMENRKKSWNPLRWFK
jgi:hypothetical protein